MSQKLIWPDYENCIANIPNSILQKFKLPTVGKTLPLVDKYLQKDYKNIVFLLLDGMGKWIVEKHLSEEGVFRTHLVGTTNSVFLSTTVAATTSAMSGMQPCEHAWLGWDCYYPKINKTVTVFLNKIQNTEEDAAPYHVAWAYTPYKSVVEKIQEAGGHAYACTPFLTPFHKDFDSIIESVKELCTKEEPDSKPKYIYAYWNQPDGLLHRHGSDSSLVHETMQTLEKTVAKLVREAEDTLIIVTASRSY